MFQTVMNNLLLLLATLATTATTANGYKDDSYYKAGSGNPNVYQSMYWKDADNILEDLDQFQYLYVEFQHCAWSWMNYGNGDDDGDVEENDYWYQGKVPPMGANVAFSLYGSLKGSSFSGCSKDTFINSFYTSTGFQEFSYAMKYAGLSGFYYNDYSAYSAECQGYSGVGCDATNGFAVHSYSTQECNPQYFTGVTNNLYSLNQAMKSAQCIKIYDRSKGTNWNGSNVTVSGTPLELLAYSNACFYQNYWSPDGQCPDPYGKIAFYQQNFNRGVVRSQKSDPFAQYSIQMQEARRLSHYGATMLVGAVIVFIIGLTWPKAAPRVRQAKQRIGAMATAAKTRALGCAGKEAITEGSSLDDADIMAVRSTDDNDDQQGAIVKVSPLDDSLKKKGLARLFQK